jgi:hypothetical protein
MEKLDFAGTAQKLSRNPLGIVALFLVLVYGIAALVFGVGSSKLDPTQTWAFVGFLCLFPILVLAVFVWLVTRHHTKLYAPADFRRDEGFLSAIDPSKVRLQITRGGASNSDIDQLIHELDEVKKTVNALSGDGPRAAQAAVNHP